jgi:hypothetical protein
MSCSRPANRHRAPARNRKRASVQLSAGTLAYNHRWGLRGCRWPDWCTATGSSAGW